MDSILTSIKKLLGIEEDYTHFDPDIIMHINSALTVLNQLGVGPTAGFVITSADETWSEYLGTTSNLDSVKPYVYLKVRLIFDPPSGTSTIEAFERQIKEFEWRLNAQVEEPTI